MSAGRGVIIRNNEDLDIPASVLTSGRDVLIEKNRRVRFIPDDQFDDVARAERSEEPVSDDEETAS